MNVRRNGDSAKLYVNVMTKFGEMRIYRQNEKMPSVIEVLRHM